MKKSQGISLISLIVTIVVIIILSGVVIYNGLGENIDQTINTMDYNEIFEISEAVAQRALFNKLNNESYELIGTPIIEEYKIDNVVYTPAQGWYLIDGNSAKGLNLEKVRKRYLVNYETNEVISLDAVEYEGNDYYVASDLKDAIGGGTVIISSNRYDEAKGINKPFVVSGMVPVKRVGNNWVVTTVDDNEWYDYAANDVANEAGNLWANVMLMDEIEVEDMTNSEVREANISDMAGKRVTKEGSMYVWLPRYSRGTIEGTTKIVYSRLTEDRFSTDSDVNVLDAFRSKGVELTGIWISKYDAGYIQK